MLNIDKELLRSRKVLVVGDLMLDWYIHCDMIKISAEAPIPVVRRRSQEFRLGGAANVAANISALGATVDILGLVGQDTEGEITYDLLKENGVGISFLSRPKNFETITKQRILVDQQQLLRVDNELHVPFPEYDLFAVFKANCEKYDIIVLSDYGKGALHDHQRYINLSNSLKCKVFIDPKGDDYNLYRGAFVVTPNLIEFERIVGQCDSLEVIVNKAKELRKSLQLKNIIVTLSDKGMLLVNEFESVHVETEASEVFDVTGAGDTVLAALAVFSDDNDSLVGAVSLANTAAGIAVQKHGTAVVSLENIEQQINGRRMQKTKLLTASEAQNIIRNAKSNNESVVMTNGCFDILHAGHVSYLQAAKNLGNTLIVALNSDESVARLKGVSRPINSLDARASVISGLQSVDYVVSFEEDTPLELYNSLLPDIIAKGGDYTTEEIIGGKEIISNGGSVAVLPFLDGYSTTDLVANIKSSKIK